LLLDEARMKEGMKIEDMPNFAKRLNSLISKAL